MFQLGCKLFPCYLWVQGPFGVLVVWCVLFLKFPEPLRLQGASGNFLVLRIKVCKTVRVVMLYGVQPSGKEGLKRGLLSY